MNKYGNKFLVFLVVFSNYALAQNVQMFSDSVPSAEQMGALIFPAEEIQAPSIKTRSLRFLSQSETQPKQEIQAEIKKSVTIGYPIRFDLNSVNLNESSFGFLNQIGKMMTMEKFAGNNLIIEGHTDAKGSSRYNQKLSEKRAGAVKQYLQEHYEIEEARLTVVGLGESEILQGALPNDAINRRVQFRKRP